MGLYDRVADLPLTVDSLDVRQQSRETSSDFTRTTTTFELSGEDSVGCGEDVTYDADDHEALAEAGLPADVAGEYATFDDYSTALDGVELFPEPPQREDSRHYRRWALESAGLDLALRQADTNLGTALGRGYEPVRFVVSTRVESFERIDRLFDVDPDAEFKLDPTPEWSAELVERLAATGRVCVLDLKGQYGWTDAETRADPDSYRRIVESFPDVVVEDPDLTDETRPIVETARERVSWDAPITGVESIRDLPFEPRWLNIKPSRFGTVQSLFDALDYCEERDIDRYGGGQFELDVGREHIQALASLCYPDSPNDVAPGGYNDPDPTPDLPRSPLPAPTGPTGLDFE